MKKNYVRPKVYIIYTNVEDALLAGTRGGAGMDDTTQAKAHDFGLEEFSDDPLWSDEKEGNNK